MITDPKFKLTYIKEHTYLALKPIFASREYAFTKKLNAKKGVANNFSITIHFVYNNYYLHHYELYFHGAIADCFSLGPLKELFETMQKELGVKAVNNYLWSLEFYLGDFLEEFHNEFRAVRRSQSFRFKSEEELEESLIEMAHILVNKTLPTIEILTDFDKMRQNIPELIEMFRDTYLNVYYILVFSAIHIPGDFKEIFSLVSKSVEEIKTRGDKWSTFFNHLDYVNYYLNNKYVTGPKR